MAADWPASPIERRTAAASRTTSWPSTIARPWSGRSRVVRMRTAVVLPAPLGPSTPSTVPRGTDRSMPLNACTSPNDLVKPSTRIAGPELTCPTTSSLSGREPRNVRAKNLPSPVDRVRRQSVPGRPEPVGQCGAHRGRGCEDAGAVGQAVAVQREAQCAFAEHYRCGLVPRVAAGRGVGDVPRAGRRARVDLHPEPARPARLFAGTLAGLWQHVVEQRPG